jgi:hypothetical protein
MASDNFCQRVPTLDNVWVLIEYKTRGQQFCIAVKRRLGVGMSGKRFLLLIAGAYFLFCSAISHADDLSKLSEQQLLDRLSQPDTNLDEIDYALEFKRRAANWEALPANQRRYLNAFDPETIDRLMDMFTRNPIPALPLEGKINRTRRILRTRATKILAEIVPILDRSMQDRLKTYHWRTMWPRTDYEERSSAMHLMGEIKPRPSLLTGKSKAVSGRTAITVYIQSCLQPWRRQSPNTASIWK